MHVSDILTRVYLLYVCVHVSVLLFVLSRLYDLSVFRLSVWALCLN